MNQVQEQYTTAKWLLLNWSKAKNAARFTLVLLYQQVFTIRLPVTHKLPSNIEKFIKTTTAVFNVRVKTYPRDLKKIIHMVHDETVASRNLVEAVFFAKRFANQYINTYFVILCNKLCNNDNSIILFLTTLWQFCIIAQYRVTSTHRMTLVVAGKLF